MNSGGVYRSSDHGETWTLVTGGLPMQPRNPSTNVVAAVPSPGETEGTTLFAGISYRGLYRSTDYGEHWSQATSGLDDPNVTDLIAASASEGTRLYAGTMNLNSSIYSGVYRSTDNGTQWTALLRNTQVISVAVIQTSGATPGIAILAGTTNGLILRTTDEGTTWTEWNSGKPNTYVGDLCVYSDSVGSNKSMAFAAIGGDVFRSSDEGVNWSLADAGLRTTEVKCLVSQSAPDASGNVTLFAGTSNGVFVSTDSGSSWSAASQAMNPKALCLVTSGSHVSCGTYDGGVYASADDGAHWSPISDGLTNLVVRKLALTPVPGDPGFTYLFAATDDGVFQSVDSGKHWGRPATGLAGIRVFDFAMISSHAATDGVQVFAGTDNGVFLSTNFGKTWTTKNAGFAYLDVRTLAVDSSAGVGDSSYFYAGTDGAGMYVSTNNGTNWSKTGMGFSEDEDYLFSLLVVPGPTTTGEVYVVAGTGGGVCVSSDHGKTWTKTATLRPGYSGPVRYEHVLSLAAYGTTLFAGLMRASAGLPGGVFATTDMGVTWRNVSTGMAGYAVNALVIHNSYLYAGTSSNSVWKRPLSEMITPVNATGIELPCRFGLEQNYPNPFNPTTTIAYALPRSAMVRLCVYDILGREVAVLVNERRDAGFHEVKFDGSNLASGVYFYRLTAGDFVQSKRMLVLK